MLGYLKFQICTPIDIFEFYYSKYVTFNVFLINVERVVILFVQFIFEMKRFVFFRKVEPSNHCVSKYK